MSDKAQILVIKSTPRVDVLRTTSLLKPLRERYPAGNIIWAVSRRSKVILRDNPLIDEILPLEDAGTLAVILNTRFEAVYNFNSTLVSCSAANLARSPNKLGFFADEYGSIRAFDESARLLDIGSDKLGVSYQRALYLTAGFENAAIEEMIFSVSNRAKDCAKTFLAENHLKTGSKPIVLICQGKSAFNVESRYPARKVSFLAEQLTDELNANVILFSDLAGKETHERAFAGCPPGVINGGCCGHLQRFSALISLSDLVITGDSIGLNIALALGKKAVVLTGVNERRDLELYNRGKRITASEGIETITPETIVETVRELL